MSNKQQRAMIACVACPHCGALVGQECRNAKTGEPLPLRSNGRRGKLLNVCKARRLAFAARTDPINESLDRVSKF